MLKRLYIVRHGDHQIRGLLSELGEEQAKKLGEKIQARQEEIPHIFHSPTPRTSRHAKIMAEILGAKTQVSEVLESSEDIDPRLDAALELLKTAESEVVILVTHYEYSRDLPRYFGSRFLSINTFPGSEGLSKGAAWDIQCADKICTLMRPFL